MSPSLTKVEDLLQRRKTGDGLPLDLLFDASRRRLAALARRLLKNYPRVARWEQVEDLLQNVYLRLLRALTHPSAPPPETARDFYRLAAYHIRHELLNLARHYYGVRGVGANHASIAGLDPAQRRAQASLEPEDEDTDPARLTRWTEFHELIEALPPPRRELFDLLYYQGLTHAEAAALLGLDERTIRRRWHEARAVLQEQVGAAWFDA
jgi:RNA polymerase sigma factor (sigma-70 family)